MVGSVFAQSTPKPSVPEFTLSFVDKSYDVPTTHTTDPYTGQDVTQQGYHVNRTALVMAIQNQQLVYEYSGSFLYNIRVKGHYAENWTQLYLNDNIPVASTSFDQTLITIGFLEGNSVGPIGDRYIIVPAGGEEDFQVQAMIGGFFKAGFDHTEFSGETSDWSNTQTITIPTPTPPPTASPTPTSAPTSTHSHEPQRAEMATIFLGAVVVAIGLGAGLGLLIYLIKRK
jgi:hypothetical protein